MSDIAYQFCMSKPLVREELYAYLVLEKSLMEVRAISRAVGTAIDAS